MFGIILRASVHASPFWRLVDKASALEREPSIRALGYPPHITLARYPGIAPALLLQAAEECAGEESCSLTFDRIGMFDVDPVVLWLSPRPNQRLSLLHGTIHRIISPDLCDPYYRPQGWTPHLTLAMAVSRARRTEALDFAAQPIEPFELLFDAVDCVSWPPIRVLHTIPLRAATPLRGLEAQGAHD